MPAASAAATLAAALLLAPTGPTLVLHLQDPRITESSGLTVSARHPGVLWTHNDGGSVALVMAVDRTGRTVATVQLRGIDPYDPEALAPGRDPQGRPALFLGDIGDNSRRRPDVSVFRFPEPGRLRDQTVTATWFKLTYPDGPHDAEALLVRPRDGRIWVATKDVFGGGLYEAPARLRTDRPNPLTRIGDVPGLVTDGAFLPDGRFVLRTYTAAYLYSAPGRLLGQEILPEQQQGESLAVDGSRLLVGSEGNDSPVYAVPIPASTASPTAAPSGSPTPTAAPSRPTGGARERSSARSTFDHYGLLAGLAATAAVLTAAVALLRQRRRRPD